MLFSQSIMTTWESLPTAAFPMISISGAPTDMEIVSHIKVTNIGSTPMKIKVVREVISQVDLTGHQFCWAGACFPPDTDTSANFQSLAPGESTDEFSGHLSPNGTFGISTFKYTFYDIDNPSEAVSIIILYNSLFELKCEAGDSVSPHARMISGTPDVVSHGKIDVHNYSPMPLNLVAFKQPFSIVENTTNWFFFDGVEYPFGTDTSGLVTIPGSTTDESFEFFYDADGHPGVSQMIYVFNDPTIPGNYAIYMIGYADNTGISDDILANTTFSPAYPNPADNFVSFNYDIPNEVRQADLLITNLLGAVVYEGSLQGLTGTKRIDVSNLTEGIYFATLKLDNEIAISQKILVQ
jgi:hypothetical protein